MYLFFDTETTGKHKNLYASISEVDNFARLVQLGFIVMDGKLTILEAEFIVKPDGFEIPVEASNVHGITTEMALEKGKPVKEVLDGFAFWVSVCDVIVGHNISYDLGTIGAEYWRIYQKNPFEGKNTICTMKSSTEFCKIPQQKYSFYVHYKYPKLSELYKILFNESMGAAHTALQDIQNTAKCYFALVERGIIK